MTPDDAKSVPRIIRDEMACGLGGVAGKFPLRIGDRAGFGGREQPRTDAGTLQRRFDAELTEETHLVAPVPVGIIWGR